MRGGVTRRDEFKSGQTRHGADRESEGRSGQVTPGLRLVGGIGHLGRLR